MSIAACAEYGIDPSLFNKVCPGEYRTNAEGFARMYISGLHRYVSQLEERVRSLQKEVALKEEMIQLLKSSGFPRPSAPPRQVFDASGRPV